MRPLQALIIQGPGLMAQTSPKVEFPFLNSSEDINFPVSKGFEADVRLFDVGLNDEEDSWEQSHDGKWCHRVG